MGSGVNYSGLVVAGLGFFLTRFTVVLAIYDDPLRFYLAGIVPLALGLGLAAFGIALTVADVETSLVRTTALWALIGFVTMLVLVVLTLLGSSTGEPLEFTAIRSQTYLSNFLIGGSVGGTLTGLYAARNRRQRAELQQQTNRLVTLNRLLRHEVLNSVTAIRGWANVNPDQNPEAMTVIDERGDDIEQIIEELKYLTASADEDSGTAPIDVDDALTETIERIAQRYPDASVTVESDADGVRVRANERLEAVFTNLIENAIVHGNDETPTVTVDVLPATVSVTVTDEGDGLPTSQQHLLETGDIQEFDNPRKGFGLNYVRLLVESYDGTVDTHVDDDGTSITVTLQRAGNPTDDPRTGPRLTGVKPALPHLTVSFLAAILAGVFYGISSETLGGSVAAIGVFYGTSNAVVGWLTHEFHSVVFGFVYVGLLSIALQRYADSIRTYLGVGLLWGLVLWAVAAGVVAPLWLRLLGIPASIPTFRWPLFVSHVVWGVSLALLTALGYRHVAPWLVDLELRVRSRIGDNRTR